MAYSVKATNQAGMMQLETPLEMNAALRTVLELRKQGFEHIRIIDLETATEVADLEAFMKVGGENG